MKILVAGGAGYIGAVSVDRLLEAGHEVTILDDLSTGHRAAIADGARLIEGSYGDAALLGQVLAGLVKRTSKEARTLNIGSAADVKNWKL